jgi:hypothetical protein
MNINDLTKEEKDAISWRIFHGMGTETDAIYVANFAIQLKSLCTKLHSFALVDISRGPAYPEWCKVMKKAKDSLGLDHGIPENVMKEK